MSAAIERQLAGKETADCPTCGTQLSVRADAIGRVRTRCPKCDRVSPGSPRHPDDAMVPQTLVRAPARNQLPPIAEGQLRCQRCAKGVTGRGRLCPDCVRQAKGAGSRSRRIHPPRPKGTLGARVYRPKVCARCAASFQPTGPRALFCEACR